MCGIVGQIGLKKDLKIIKSEVERMMDIITYRGPDGEGIYQDSRAIFGMRRLSIIDLNNGWQPIYNEDFSIVVVLNGEIYNYKELRKQLIHKGHQFRSLSDTEVIVHLYEEYGDQFIQQLNGMFSFCLYDINRQRVIIARDRIGIKPLYYSILNEKVYFASEIKSILTCSDFPRIVDEIGLSHYLSFNYVPQPFTLFKHIKKVKPGFMLIIKNNIVEEKMYWDVPLKSNYNLTENQISKKINKKIQQSVKLRLRSDVPLGAFLSGGLDSSIIVSKTTKLIKNPLNTFSIGFKEEKFSELPYSNKVAKLFKTDHTTKIVEPDLISQLNKSIWHNDNPHGDVSFMPTNTVSELASKKVTVVLTGDGGDELFAGYEKYVKYENFSCDEKSYRKYFEDVSVFNLEMKNKLLNNDFSKKINDEVDSFYIANEYFKKYNKQNKDFINSILYSEIKLLLEGNNLVKPDRMGMAESIEARVPFLDHNFVEFAASIPSEYKLKNKTTKYILKKAMENYLPWDIIYRDKQMFTVPIGEWFKKDLKDLVYNVLLDSRTEKRGYFNSNYIKQLIDEHMTEKKDRTRELRNLLILEIWHRMYIDNFFDKPPSMCELGIKFDA